MPRVIYPGGTASDWVGLLRSLENTTFTATYTGAESYDFMNTYPITISSGQKGVLFSVGAFVQATRQITSGMGYYYLNRGTELIWYGALTEVTLVNTNLIRHYFDHVANLFMIPGEYGFTIRLLGYLWDEGTVNIYGGFNYYIVGSV